MAVETKSWNNPAVMARRAQYMPLYQQAASAHGVPLDLLLSIGYVESRYNPAAVGVPTKWGRAKGIGQFIAPTAREMGLRVDDQVDDRLDPRKNIDATARYLAKLYKQHKSWDVATERYMGTGPVARQYVTDVAQVRALVSGVKVGTPPPSAPVAQYAQVAPKTSQPRQASAAPMPMQAASVQDPIAPFRPRAEVTAARRPATIPKAPFTLQDYANGRYPTLFELLTPV